MRVAQFRYFGGDSNIEGSLYDREGTWLSNILSNNSTEVIKKIGIQTLPGTGVYINKNITPIVVNETGILEIDVKSGLQITSISFDKKSIEAIAANTRKENDENVKVASDFSYLIVDFLIATEEEIQSTTEEDSSSGTE